MDSFIYNSKMYIKNNGANIVFSFRNKSINVKKNPRPNSLKRWTENMSDLFAHKKIPEKENQGSLFQG